MTGITYLNNEMDSAPEINHNAGSLIAVIEACLINGFGSQSPQGDWEVIKNGAGTKAAFRSTTSPYGIWLYIDDTGTNQATCTLAETFTGFDGSDEPIGDLSGPVDKYISKNHDADRPAPWRIFADDRFFYIFVRYHYGTNDFSEGGWLKVWQSSYGISSYSWGGKWVQTVFCFGDLVGVPSLDSYPVVLYSQRDSASGSDQQRSGRLGTFDGPSTSQRVIARGYDQVTKLPEVGQVASWIEDVPYPMVTSPGGIVLLGSPSVYEDNRALRGSIPGYYPIPHSPGDSGDSALDDDFDKWDDIGPLLTGTSLEGRSVIVTGVPVYTSGIAERRMGAFDATGPWR